MPWLRLHARATAGVDKQGREVVWITGRHLPAVGMDLERIRWYIYTKLQSVAERGKFVIVYMHTDATWEVCPTFPPVSNLPGGGVWVVWPRCASLSAGPPLEVVFIQITVVYATLSALWLGNVRCRELLPPQACAVGKPTAVPDRRLGLGGQWKPHDARSIQ